MERLAGYAEGVHGRAAEQARTNREVAAELYMGLRTVEAHLSAIYRKLGVRSSSELARTWAGRDSSGS